MNVTLEVAEAKAKDLLIACTSLSTDKHTYAKIRIMVAAIIHINAHARMALHSMPDTVPVDIRELLGTMADDSEKTEARTIFTSAVEFVGEISRWFELARDCGSPTFYHHCVAIMDAVAMVVDCYELLDEDEGVYHDSL